MTPTTLLDPRDVALDATDKALLRESAVLDRRDVQNRARMSNLRRAPKYALLISDVDEWQSTQRPESQEVYDALWAEFNAELAPLKAEEREIERARFSINQRRIAARHDAANIVVGPTIEIPDIPADLYEQADAIVDELIAERDATVRELEQLKADSIVVKAALAEALQRAEAIAARARVGLASPAEIKTADGAVKAASEALEKINGQVTERERRLPSIDAKLGQRQRTVAADLQARRAKESTRVDEGFQDAYIALMKISTYRDKLRALTGAHDGPACPELNADLPQSRGRLVLQKLAELAR